MECGGLRTATPYPALQPETIPAIALNVRAESADGVRMDRIIRNRKNKRYLTAAGKWVSDRSRAQTFFFADDARLFCLEHGFKADVEGVVVCGTFESEFELFGK